MPAGDDKKNVPCNKSTLQQKIILGDLTFYIYLWLNAKTCVLYVAQSCPRNLYDLYAGVLDLTSSLRGAASRGPFPQ